MSGDDVSGGDDEDVTRSRHGDERHETSGSFGLESLLGHLVPAPDSVPPDWLLGATIGGTEVVRLIATGGMGCVYEAIQDQPRRSVAVKVIRPALLGSAAPELRSKVVARFLQEAQILSQLRHPGITHVYAAGTAPVDGVDIAYLVMEYIPEARPITAYAREHDLSLTPRLRLFLQVCEAVAYAHDRGVVHRDLKPSNVLIDDLGRPKLIDFGISRSIRPATPVMAPPRAAELGEAAGAPLHASNGHETDGERLVGTLPYLAPEQLSGGAQGGDARSDVYALGVILYELVTGRRPFGVDDRGTQVAIARIVKEPPPDPGQAVGVTPVLAAVMLQCLAKDPADRFQTASDAANAVAHAIADLADREAAASLSDVERGVAATTAPRMTRRSLVLGGGGIAATLAAAVAVRGLPGLRGLGPTVAKLDPPPATEFRYDDIRAAAPYLVDVTNMKVYREEWWVKMGMPELTYWGPEQNDVEGSLLYRFPFGRRVPKVTLSAMCACHIFGEGQGGDGRGAAALEASADGVSWTTLADGIEPRQWGVYIGFDDTLPSHLLGHAELWLRVRCLTQGCPNDSYSTAQFGRAGIHQEPVFALTAEEPRRV